jgi:hypothetical protein
LPGHFDVGDIGTQSPFSLIWRYFLYVAALATLRHQETTATPKCPAVFILWPPAPHQGFLIVTDCP